MKYLCLCFAGLIAALISNPAYTQSNLDIKKLDSLFDSLESSNRMMGSVTLTKDGKVIYDRALGYRSISEEGKVRSDAKTLFRIGSITKVFTAVMIWQLIEEKKLTLDTRLAAFFPQIPNADNITVAHLLSHTSGLREYAGVGYDPADPKSWVFFPQTSTQMIARFTALKPDFDPGEKRRYSNTNYALLGYIIESLTDSTYASQLDKRIVRKINLKRTRYDGKIDPANNEAESYVFNDGKWNKNYAEALSIAGGAGGIVSTTADITKFIAALGSHKLISKKSYDAMTSPFIDKFPDSHLGIAMFTLRGIDKKAISKQGGIDAFTANVVYVPEDELAFALTINGHNYPMSKIFWNVLDIYYNRPVQLPSFKTIELSADALSQYEGVFALKGTAIKITVKKEKSALAAQATGQDSFLLNAIGASTFADEASGIILEFSKDTDGSIRQFTLFQGRSASDWEKEK